MTDPFPQPGAGAGADDGAEPTNTEAANDGVTPPGAGSRPAPGQGAAPGAASGGEDDVLEAEVLDGDVADGDVDDAAAGAGAAAAGSDAQLAAERLEDLQRLQAEYVNYKRRVDRDRAVIQERAVQSVLDALLPVLDDVHAAREHGDLAGSPFERIAEKLEGSLGRFGLERFGERGEAFDPTLHEALMHAEWPADDGLPTDLGTTVVQVLQPGYRAGEQVIRPARVSVADPA